MHTLLSVQEAFAAKQAGKNVVCRHAESEYFESLDRVSAETWFDPHYVFALQIETIVVAGFEFTKPYTLDELTTGQEIFYIGASGTILKGTFNPDNEMLVSGVNNGSVQRDEENAIKQIKAVRSLLGITSDEPTVIDYDFFLVDEESTKSETKKRRGGRKSKDTQPAVSDEHVPLDKTDTAIKVFTDKIDAASMTYELEEIQANLNDSKDKLHPEEVEQINALIAEKQNQIDKLAGDTAIELMIERLQSITTIGSLNDLEVDVKNQKLATPVVAENCDQLLIDIAAKREKLNQIDFIDHEQQHDNDPKGVVSTFTLQINEAKNIADLKNVELEINKFWSLNETDRLDLKHRLKFRRDELEMQSGSISELKELQKAAENLSSYQAQLLDLTSRVQNAQTVDEANEPVTQTLDWTAEQRLPLITAISKRLVELGKPLIAQIREVNDLDTLEVYLAQIHELIAVDGTLAHQCMQAYTVRKSSLTQTSPA
ncbi:MAG: hypothetical protein E7D55_02340 [Acinetobacter junii]|nr:hypothetical protein [Acinetobacter junii]